MRDVYYMAEIAGISQAVIDIIYEMLKAGEVTAKDREYLLGLIERYKKRVEEIESENEIHQN
jgi:aspartate/glutamate racemase